MSNELNQDLGRDSDQDSGRGERGVPAAGDLVVGLDAGGTRTRAVLASASDGRPLGEGVAGPGNALTVPVPQLTEHLVEALAGAVPEADRPRVVAVAGGFAGAAGSADEPGRVNALTALTEALRRLGIPAHEIRIRSDIEAAFAAAPGPAGPPADGLALVAGTGAVAMRIADRHCEKTVGGDGWLLGDDGGGFWIGREAVRAALRMADRRGGDTALAALVGRELGVPDAVLSSVGEASAYEGESGVGSPWSRSAREAYRRHVLPAVMAEPPVRLARLAPLVAEAARHGDALAQAIIEEAAGHLVDCVRALEPRPGESLVSTGGLLGPEGPLTVPLDRRLSPLGLVAHWVPDGSRGAVALARLARDGGPDTHPEKNQ
ncbi:BadF/BadG/BcrA/BcrD ATPase family protein [Streptomyces turgidiscabies]|uniref:BadF/BadG/BcrA/BcrD ATPase family protein n=1 Tax=Streptomyces turgidiscabies (strain Car8) TaxID=698760 RepID=L7ETD8_STRT8|nr:MULTISPECIES: BadF/BadG/BcrA/BcrD ATPase family protein [Streptomyces]ELP62287.1 BadF/BadG/BcrA/BcrD ATPase family protein [Streptomyces turgidiscabies Car8]MDX3498751.1 BadF/BadG/BcrA/BcrD ATPase family protein [Streptomyces turgidiscabies]GAQ74822.1 BadF/BadG/BcrA/BcrD ATPase family protein [Streptomyces turgidiscabies]